MKKAITLIFILALLWLNMVGQQIVTPQRVQKSENTKENEWVKNPSTNMYSLEYENKYIEDLYKQSQKKYAANADIKKISSDLESTNEEQKLKALKTLALMP